MTKASLNYPARTDPDDPFVRLVVDAGVGCPGGGAHAPNENIRLEDYMKGARHIARILGEFGKN